MRSAPAQQNPSGQGSAAEQRFEHCFPTLGFAFGAIHAVVCSVLHSKKPSQPSPRFLVVGGVGPLETTWSVAREPVATCQPSTTLSIGIRSTNRVIPQLGGPW
jgi:hypothetical protein